MPVLDRKEPCVASKACSSLSSFQIRLDGLNKIPHENQSFKTQSWRPKPFLPPKLSCKSQQKSNCWIHRYRWVTFEEIDTSILAKLLGSQASFEKQFLSVNTGFYSIYLLSFHIFYCRPINKSFARPFSVLSQIILSASPLSIVFYPDRWSLVGMCKRWGSIAILSKSVLSDQTDYGTSKSSWCNPCIASVQPSYCWEVC